MRSYRTRKNIGYVLWAIPTTLCIIGAVLNSIDLIALSAIFSIGTLTSITFGNGVYFYMKDGR